MFARKQPQHSQEHSQQQPQQPSPPTTQQQPQPQQYSQQQQQQQYILHYLYRTGRHPCRPFAGPSGQGPAGLVGARNGPRRGTLDRPKPARPVRVRPRSLAGRVPSVLVASLGYPAGRPSTTAVVLGHPVGAGPLGRAGWLSPGSSVSPYRPLGGLSPTALAFRGLLGPALGSSSVAHGTNPL